MAIILYGYLCMWHHVKEGVQIELELQMKKSGDEESECTVHYNSSKSVGQKMSGI